MVTANSAPAGAPFNVGERVNVLYRSREQSGLAMALNRELTALLRDFDGQRWHASVDLPPDVHPGWENDYVLTPQGASGFLVRSSRSGCAACAAYAGKRYCAWHEDERTDP